MTAGTKDNPLATMQAQSSAVQSLTDEQLVQRLCAGEAAAGQALVQRHHLHLLRYLQRLTGDDQLAEELLQATWLSALENLQRFQSWPVGGGFKAWLFRIATNKANDLWRRRWRESVADQDLELVTDEQGQDASRRLESAEQQQKLLWAIEQLPANQRQVLLLRYYSGMKFIDIAQALGCPLNTVLGRMHKAMLKLKRWMEDE